MPANGDGNFSRKPRLDGIAPVTPVFRAPAETIYSAPQAVDALGRIQNPYMVNIFISPSAKETVSFKSGVSTVATVKKADLPSVAIGLHDLGQEKLKTLIVKIANVPGVSISNESIPWLQETLQAFRNQHEARLAAATLAAQPAAT